MTKLLPYNCNASFLWCGSRRSYNFNTKDRLSAIRHIRAKYKGALDICVSLQPNYEVCEQLSLF